MQCLLYNSIIIINEVTQLCCTFTGVTESKIETTHDSCPLIAKVILGHKVNKSGKDNVTYQGNINCHIIDRMIAKNILLIQKTIP